MFHMISYQQCVFVLCFQVSWHWRGIVELDQLWMPKCVRLAWTLPFSPTPYETSVWKRLYVETVRMLRCTAGPQVRGVSGGVSAGRGGRLKS